MTTAQRKLVNDALAAEFGASAVETLLLDGSFQTSDITFGEQEYIKQSSTAAIRRTSDLDDFNTPPTNFGEVSSTLDSIPRGFFQATAQVNTAKLKRSYAGDALRAYLMAKAIGRASALEVNAQAVNLISGARTLIEEDKDGAALSGAAGQPQVSYAAAGDARSQNIGAAGTGIQLDGIPEGDIADTYNTALKRVMFRLGNMGIHLAGEAVVGEQPARIVVLANIEVADMLAEWYAEKSQLRTAGDFADDAIVRRGIRSTEAWRGTHIAGFEIVGSTNLSRPGTTAGSANTPGDWWNTYVFPTQGACAMTVNVENELQDNWSMPGVPHIEYNMRTTTLGLKALRVDWMNRIRVRATA